MVRGSVMAVEMVGDLDRALIRDRALQRFSPEHMVDQYEDVYRKLLEDRGHEERPPFARIRAISVAPTDADGVMTDSGERAEETAG